MGILGRINRVIKSNVNELVDKMTDPAREIDLLIVEMEQGFRQAKEEVVTATADAKRAEMHAEECVLAADRWQDRAEAAVRGGDDELAREALTQKMQADRDLEVARRAAAEQRTYVEELKNSLKQLDVRLKDVKMRKETFKQRARAGKQGNSGGLSGTEAFERFDALEGRMEAAEELQEVTASVAEREAVTDAKIRAIARNARDPKIEDALAALKARADPPKLPAGGANE
ncbi:MAG: PspA/IM30 family protein [Deltaproteobacteria bacterium]|nr:PspA/IM30 family protein [Deltaproteobacteria bacterium]